MFILQSLSELGSPLSAQQLKLRAIKIFLKINI